MDFEQEILRKIVRALRSKTALAASLILLFLPWTVGLVAAKGKVPKPGILDTVIGSIASPTTLREGDKLAEGLTVTSDKKSLIVVETRWASDIPDTDCIEVAVFGNGESHTVKRGNPKTCIQTAPQIPSAALAGAQPFIARETHYGDGPYDRFGPRLDANSEARRADFNRWLSETKLNPMIHTKRGNSPTVDPSIAKADAPPLSKQVAVEPWQCSLQLHGRGAATLQFTRSNEQSDIVGNVSAKDGGATYAIVGKWRSVGDRIDFKKDALETSEEEFAGIVIKRSERELKIAGRFGAGFSGVWSADCVSK